MIQFSNSFSVQPQSMGARRIYEALKDQIIEGVYGSAGLLPSSRALAMELGVSRTTVTVAYDQLTAEGFIEVRQGARPRVAPSVVNQGRAVLSQATIGPTWLSAYGERLKDIPPRSETRIRHHVADFRHGDLARSDFPVLAWRKAVVAAMKEGESRLAYSDPCGSNSLRLALQGYLWRARRLRCDPDQIIIVNGSQQGLDLCARILLDRNDRFVIENPCYGMARNVFRATGAAAIPIDVDRDGMNTQLLTGIAAKLAYVTPSHQFPLGGVMPIGRRHQLLDWAREADAYVIEDDYDGEYRYDINPVPPLCALEESGNVIYVGTVSKTLSPTLRLGYLVVPPQLRDVFAMAKLLTDRHTPATEQEALAMLLETGAYERHVRRVRRRNGDRRAALLKALRHEFGESIIVEGADAGLHIVVWFPNLPRYLDAALVEGTREKGVGIYPVAPLYDRDFTSAYPRSLGLVIGYSALDPRRIERGIQILADAVDRISHMTTLGGR